MSLGLSCLCSQVGQSWTISSPSINPRPGTPAVTSHSIPKTQPAPMSSAHSPLESIFPFEAAQKFGITPVPHPNLSLQGLWGQQGSRALCSQHQGHRNKGQSKKELVRSGWVPAGRAVRLGAGDASQHALSVSSAHAKRQGEQGIGHSRLS